MRRIAGANAKGCKGEEERGVHSWEAHVKDCKADTAAQTDTARSWETNVKDCKREADTAAQNWETNGKDCKAEVGTTQQEGKQKETSRQKGDKADTMTNKNPLHVPPSSGLRRPPLHVSPSSGLLRPPLPCNPLH